MLHIIQWRALLLVRARFINSLVIKRKRISKQTTKVWPQVNESMPLIPCNEQNPLKNTIDIFFSILPEYPPLALLTFFFSFMYNMYVCQQTKNWTILLLMLLLFMSINSHIVLLLNVFLCVLKYTNTLISNYFCFDR